MFADITGVLFFTLSALFFLAFAGLGRVKLLGCGKSLATRFVIAFEHRIFEQIALDFLLHFNSR